MSDKPYLDKEAILNASELVNSTLMSKGYITEKLLFNTINWNEIRPNDGEDGEGGKGEVLTESIYNNDKNIINIIYSLIQSIERNSIQNKTFNKIVSQKDSQIEQLKQKLSAVESKLDASEKKLSSFENSDKVRLENKIMALTKANKSLSQDIVRMKNFTSDYQSKYAIQSKKKNTEIQQLRDRLSDKSMGRASMGSDVNYSLVYNNNPSINNPNGGPLAALGEPLKKEYENIMTDLSVLIENLILENYKFSKFIQLIATYFSELNVNISSFNSDKSSIDIPNPSTMIDFESLQTTTHVSQNESTDELESFDSVAKPLLNSVYRNFHYIVDLVEHLRRQNNEDPQIINNLENELAIVRKNWQDAITTLENWKKYKE